MHDTLKFETRPPAGGFTYLGLLIAVVVLGIAMSAVGVVWHTHAQIEREKELMFIGKQFQLAIGAYYNSNVAGGAAYPQQLTDLLIDNRSPEPRHYLRRLYTDPMTGTQDWSVVRTEGLGIIGVASSSTGVPLKRAGFSNDELEFADATCYCQWQFVYRLPFNRRRTSLGTTPR